MSPRIEAELKAALSHASEAIEPRADLADRVRRATRRRRVLMSAAAIGMAAAIVAASIAVYGHGPAGQRPDVDRHHVRRPPVVRSIAIPGEPSLIAASGRWLYAEINNHPDSVLRAYDIATGRLVRQVSFHSIGGTLQVGPGGLVWLAFCPDDLGGKTGVWLLSPDLARRSAVVILGRGRNLYVAPCDVMPTGRDTAIIAADNGLARLRLPLPGQPGSARLRWQPPVPGAGQIRGRPFQIASFAGHLAVAVVNSRDGKELITFAGQRNPPAFAAVSGAPGDSAGYIAATADGLWTTREVGPRLIRLNDQLRPDTPQRVSRDRVLVQAQQVMTFGNTVWVITNSLALSCFTDYNGHIGPIRIIHLKAAVAGNNGGGGRLAVVGDIIYVLDYSPSVLAYRVPAACR